MKDMRLRYRILLRTVLGSGGIRGIYLYQASLDLKSNSTIYSFPETSMVTIKKIKKIGSNKATIGQGKGVLISQNGIVATNRHVLQDLTASYEAILTNGMHISIDKIWHSTDKDLAFASLLITGNQVIKDLGTIQLSSHQTKVGDRIFLITTDEKKNNQIEQITNTGFLIHIDVSAGDSGTPVFNTQGELIGLITSTDPFGSGYTLITPITNQDIITNVQ